MRSRHASISNTPEMPTDEELSQGAANTLAVALAPADATVQQLIGASGGRWQPLTADIPATYWTDDFTNILSVWRR